MLLSLLLGATVEQERDRGPAEESVYGPIMDEDDDANK